MLRYLTLPVTPFQQNCSLVWDDATNQAALIDPGGDVAKLLAAVKALGLTLEPGGAVAARLRSAGAGTSGRLAAQDGAELTPGTVHIAADPASLGIEDRSTGAFDRAQTPVRRVGP